MYFYLRLTGDAGITVTKDATPLSQDEPGGGFTFDVTVTNDSAVDVVTIDTLSDDIYGDLTLAAGSDCTVPQTIQLGDTYSCSFTGTFTGNAGDTQTDVVTASGTDDDNAAVSDTDDATVTIDDALPTITVTKTANPPSVSFMGGSVTYTIKVTNSSVESVTLFSVMDDKFGDLNGQGSCSIPQLLSAQRRDIHLLVHEDPHGAVERQRPRLQAPHQHGDGHGQRRRGQCGDRTGQRDGELLLAGTDPGLLEEPPGRLAISVHPQHPRAGRLPDPKLPEDRSNLDLTKPNGPDTMLQALDYQGGSTLKGKAQILLRASVAAVLNERFFGATYPPYTSTAQLVTAVNNALASCDGATYISLATQLDFWNNGVH